MDALNDLVRSGLVRYIGMSSCYAYQFSIMQNYALSKNVSHREREASCFRGVDKIAHCVLVVLQQAAFISMQDFYNGK